MDLDTSKKAPDREDQKLFAKFIAISDKIGTFLYENKSIKKDNIVSSLKKRKQQLTPRKSSAIDFPKLIKSIPSLLKKVPTLLKNYFKKKPSKIKQPKPKPNQKRVVGGIILSIIVLIGLVIIVFVANYIINALLDIMEWWVLLEIFGVVVGVIVFAAALHIATRSNDEVYNLNRK